MLYRLPFCLFNRHQPDHGDIAHELLEVISHCRNCGRRIRRVRKGHWQSCTYLPATDDQAERG